MRINECLLIFCCNINSMLCVKGDKYAAITDSKGVSGHHFFILYHGTLSQATVSLNKMLPLPGCAGTVVTLLHLVGSLHRGVCMAACNRPARTAQLTLMCLVGSLRLVGSLCGGMLLTIWDCLLTLLKLPGSLHGSMLQATRHCPTFLTVFGGWSVLGHITGWCSVCMAVYCTAVCRLGQPNFLSCVWWVICPGACYMQAGTVSRAACYRQAGTAKLTLLHLMGGLYRAVGVFR